MSHLDSQECHRDYLFGIQSIASWQAELLSWSPFGKSNDPIFTCGNLIVMKCLAIKWFNIDRLKSYRDDLVDNLMTRWSQAEILSWWPFWKSNDPILTCGNRIVMTFGAIKWFNIDRLESYRDDLFGSQIIRCSQAEILSWLPFWKSNDPIFTCGNLIVMAFLVFNVLQVDKH